MAEVAAGAAKDFAEAGRQRCADDQRSCFPMWPTPRRAPVDPRSRHDAERRHEDQRHHGRRVRPHRHGHRDVESDAPLRRVLRGHSPPSRARGPASSAAATVAVRVLRATDDAGLQGPVDPVAAVRYDAKAIVELGGSFPADPAPRIRIGLPTRPASSAPADSSTLDQRFVVDATTVPTSSETTPRRSTTGFPRSMASGCCPRPARFTH